MGVRRVCVFCGSSYGARLEYASAASAVGQGLALRGIGLVYGGARVGLMGCVAEAALQAGGEVIGVIPASLVAKEIAHTGVSDLRIVSSMHERKALMAELSDAFLALPGGMGTLEELCEVLTWSQLGLHRKPCGLLNVAGYYDPLLDLFDHAVSEGFLKRVHREMVLSGADPDILIPSLLEYRVPVVDKWVERDEI
jgi:uncharacterized protein (TIGR00730 family)